MRSNVPVELLRGAQPPRGWLEPFVGPMFAVRTCLFEIPFFQERLALLRNGVLGIDNVLRHSVIAWGPFASNRLSLR